MVSNSYLWRDFQILLILIIVNWQSHLGFISHTRLESFVKFCYTFGVEGRKIISIVFPDPPFTKVTVLYSIHITYRILPWLSIAIPDLAAHNSARLGRAGRHGALLRVVAGCSRHAGRGGLRPQPDYGSREGRGTVALSIMVVK